MLITLEVADVTEPIGLCLSPKRVNLRYLVSLGLRNVNLFTFLGLVRASVRKRTELENDLG